MILVNRNEKLSLKEPKAKITMPVFCCTQIYLKVIWCTFKMGVTLKGKNLLLAEQIVSFKSLPRLKNKAKNENEGVASPVNVSIYLDQKKKKKK